ncbi:histone PARylation factor 1-like [Mercenaria mercenaria]|uniref:histone PARylation factor 1-like n=1 Tax=Mercenaria mercenaria TaxID=6596 RepID=UPI00234EF41D|nr:histone PARylation factor 1-like [Mercenaria mercenaria]
MASNEKPLCKFGEKCYRKNPQHLKQFRHPKRDNEEEDQPKLKKRKTDTTTKGKGKTLDDFFGKKKEEKHVEHEVSDEEVDSGEASDVDHSEANKETAEENKDSPGESPRVESDDDEDDIEPPESPVDVRENIKQKFLVEMPEDFYQFWDFCKSEKPDSPTDALKDLVGLQLVGPFDILAGKHKGVKTNRHGKRPNFLLHWRYYYDPPEFQTVVRGTADNQFHLGYFRDDPKEMPALVGANSAKTDCIISVKGDNLFAAVSSCIDDKLKSKETSAGSKTKLKELSERLQTCAKKNKQTLELKSKHIKEREKKVVCKSFHKCGIVVPVDENEVGYREVPETPADLKKMFKKIADSKTDAERDKNFEPLQELITLIQFANDECDYGEGLELGIDLFCYGGATFHSTIGQLLSLAYMLLNRPEYGQIVEAHLKNRRRGDDLSQL